MAVKYDKLWTILKEKNIKKIELQRRASISGNILARLGRNEYVSMESVEKICNVLGCKTDDILEFVSGGKE